MWRANSFAIQISLLQTRNRVGNLELLEKAFNLADSGEVSNMIELRRALVADGITMLDLHQFCGRHLNRQLSARIAWSKRKNREQN